MAPSNKRLAFIAAHVSLAGMMYGLDTGSIGPVTLLTQFEESIGQLSPTRQGIYVACILLPASVSSFISGHVSDQISRKYAILFGALITFVGTLISAVSRNLGMLFGARVITGLGIGQALAVTTVYLVEITPPDTRGIWSGLLELYIVSGVMVGYFVVYGSRNLTNSLAWRTPFVVQSVNALVLAFGTIFIPFSPRWLIQRNRVAEAGKVLTNTRGNSLAREELVEIQRTLAQSTEHHEGAFQEMFRPRYLRRTFLGIFVMVGLQMNGIDAVLYFAPIIFQQAGFTTERASFLASGVGGIILTISTIPTQIWLDKWGRRIPLVAGGASMGICFLVIGSIYAHNGVFQNGVPTLHQKSAHWIVIALVYVFIASFALSWGVVARVYSSEIIPTRLRAKVCALEQVANWVVNFAIAFTAPLFLRTSLCGPYFLYGLATLLAAFVCYFAPETKGRSLEEIEFLFEKRRASSPEPDT